MKRSETLFGLLRIPMDALAVFAALILSYRLRQANMDLIPGVQLLEPAQTLPPLDAYLSTFVYPGIVVFLFIAAAFKLYALLATRSAWNEVARLLITAFLWLIAVIGWYFLIRKQLFYSRILLVHSAFFIAVFANIGRATITLVQRAFLQCGIGVRLVVSLGTKAIAKSAKVTLEDDVRYRYLGHIDDLRELKKLERKHHIDLVVQTDPNPKSEFTNELIDYCRSNHLGYAFLPPVLADNPHQLRVDHLGLVPMLAFQPTPLDGWGRVLKRIFDIIISITLLTLLTPLLLLTLLAILITSGWPAFYVSRRLGEQGRKKIPVLKFRTMVRNADALKPSLTPKSHRSDGPLFKIKNDPRVTPIGRVLRRWSIDELPQLINVLIGQMSVVGPRPHLPEEVKQYSDFQRRVFAVKPGITGFAQISGRSNLKFDDEVRLDLQYIEEWSPFLDLWILWRTVMVVLRRDGAD